MVWAYVSLSSLFGNFSFKFSYVAGIALLQGSSTADVTCTFL